MHDAPEGYVRLDADRLAAYLADDPALTGILGGEPSQWEIREVGDGNLNLVFLVDGPVGGLCVKQSLPHIRKIESWRLSVERTYFEYHYFRAVAPYVGRAIPRIERYDPRLHCMIMEKLAPHIILRIGLIAGNVYPHVAQQIGEFVARTTFFTSNLSAKLEETFEGIARFAHNHGLERITSDLIFTDPYRMNPLNRWTSPQLDAVAARVRADVPLRLAAARRGRQFLTHTQALIHGDLHTGSVMVTPSDARVIDPEFAFYGPIGYDLGAFVGNLLMSYFSQPGHATREASRDGYAEWILAQIPIFWTTFVERFLALWETHATGDVYAPSMFADDAGRAALAGEKQAFIAELYDDMLAFAGAKMHRRILGFAHNLDFDAIADPNRRAACESATLDLARRMLVAPQSLPTIDALLDAAREIGRPCAAALARLDD